MLTVVCKLAVPVLVAQMNVAGERVNVAGADAVMP
jgi:hypothetical protein